MIGRRKINAAGRWEWSGPFLLIGFATGGMFFSLFMPRDVSAGAVGFSAESVLVMFLVAAALFSVLWFVSLLGEERRTNDAAIAATDNWGSLRGDLALVWRSRALRFFLFYVMLSMLFAFLQDTVLEPFGGEVFAMDAPATNRFSAYWGSMAIIGSFVVLWLTRRFDVLNNKNVSQAGVVVLLVAYLIFACSAFAEMRNLVRPGLIMLGIGYGVWNIGTLGLMMEMSPVGRAGTFLGFWTFCVTIARGAGVAGGGMIRDLMLSLSGEYTVAYGAVFCCGIGGLLLAALALQKVNAVDYEADIRADDERAAIAARSLE